MRRHWPPGWHVPTLRLAAATSARDGAFSICRGRISIHGFAQAGCRRFWTLKLIAHCCSAAADVLTTPASQANQSWVGITTACTPRRRFHFGRCGVEGVTGR